MRVRSVIVVVLALLLGAEVQPPARAAQRVARVVSTSGIPHHDVGNYTRSSFWRRGDPRGIPDSRTWRGTIDHVLGSLAAERADAYLHTGDMVSGRWGVDRDRPKAGIFGPTGTLAQRRAAVERAGNLYYRQNKSWWARNGIPAGSVHFGMGDHEYGNTNADGRPRSHQLAFVPRFRDVWRRHFVDGRGYRYRLDSGQQRHGSYATVLPGGVGLVTLDPILVDGGLMRARIGSAQERWLRDVLADMEVRGIDFVVVQVEIPPRGPNRAFHSGRQTLDNGAALWDLLDARDVDLVLSAEWHDVTMRSDGGSTPVQVVHGSQLYQARANYLVIDFFDDGSIEVVAKAMTGTRDTSTKLWAPDLLRAPNEVRVRARPAVVGRLGIAPDGAVIRDTGRLAEYGG